MIDYKFFDTSALLELTSNVDKPIYISSITLKELENIKISNNKSEEVKYKARRIIKQIDEHPELYRIHFYKEHMLDPIINADLPISDDMKILATAIDFDNNYHPDEVIFVSNDISLKNIANLFFGNGCIQSIKLTSSYYSGFKQVNMTEQQMAQYYENLNNNTYNLKTNEYLLIANEDGQIVDSSCWTGQTHRPLKYGNYHSELLGELKPYKNDIYQQLALDSLQNNQMTMICGRPGSGKSLLALSFLFHLLDKGEIDRIIVFCNPVVAKNAAKLGFYPGTVNEKLLSSSVGNILSSKLGSFIIVEKLLREEQLILIPAGDARGYEVPANSGVYIMESQNLTKDLMRMLLQRVSDNCKVIIDGDYKEQVDMDIYAGNNNGMKAVSDVFSGESIYGQVELQKIHRSTIADIADNLKENF